MTEKVTAASAVIAIHEAAEKIKCWDKFAGDALTLGINPMLPGEPGYRAPIYHWMPPPEPPKGE